MTSQQDIDSGYAWVICATTFAFEIIVAVVFKTFGVLHIQLEELYGYGAFKTSLVSFVMSVCWVVFSPVGGFLAYKFPRRMNIMLGALFTAGMYTDPELSINLELCYICTFLSGQFSPPKYCEWKG